jgi:ABC-2 type transport system ATP-binding protein
VQKNSIIQVNNLEKKYESFHAVKGISFEVQEGEIFGILGPNGAGKTTLIRIINQILEADRGTIRMNGQLMTHIIGALLKNGFQLALEQRFIKVA